MLNQNDKIERFSEIINKNALAQCKKIEKQTEKFRKEQLKDLESKAQAELQSRLDYEAQRITTQKGSRISSLNAESKKNLAKKREEITAAVFEKVRERLSQFTKTADYEAFLRKSIVSLVEEIGDGAVVYVRESDLPLCKEKLSDIKGVKAFEKSEKIRLGGAAASNVEKTVFAVDSLESRIAAQRELFLTQSSLSIE